MDYTIYKITNTANDKIYFGYTSQRLSARFSGHCSEPRDTYISRSIRKYGKDTFHVNTMFETDCETKAKGIEQFLIAYYKTNAIRHPRGNGMNLTDGGEGATGYRHSEELKEKWKRERKGKNSGVNHPLYGKKTAENPRSKKVYQFTLDGKFVKEYPSAKEAGESNDTYGANISLCCRGKSKTVKGYIFLYSPIFESRSLNESHTKIQQLSIDGQLINTFSSIVGAVKSLSLSDRSGIDKCLMRSNKTAHGFIWKRG